MERDFQTSGERGPSWNGFFTPVGRAMIEDRCSIWGRRSVIFEAPMTNPST